MSVFTFCQFSAQSTARRRRRGSVIIEATLTLLLFFGLVFSIVDFGLSMYFHHTLVQRVRTAVRTAVVDLKTYDGTKIRNLIVYASADGGSGPGFMDLIADDAHVRVERKNKDSSADRFVITVRDFRFTLYTYLVAGTYFGRPITIVMPIEDNAYLGKDPTV